MNSLDYVEAIMRQHETERERDLVARYRQQHPEQDAGRDSRWAGFMHRWAAHTHTVEPHTVEPQPSGSNGLDDRLVSNREVNR